jgi:predicted DNA-binding WGR domain protein
MNQHHLRFENLTNKRYYQMMISQDLFRHWILTKTWGGIGKPGGRVVHIPCLSQSDAFKLMDELSKMRYRRGYRLCSNI